MSIGNPKRHQWTEIKALRTQNSRDTKKCKSTFLVGDQMLNDNIGHIVTISIPQKNSKPVLVTLTVKMRFQTVVKIENSVVKISSKNQNLSVSKKS